MTGIPKNEIVWVRYINGNDIYYITSKITRECYYIYQIKGDRATKLGQAKSPLTLEEKYIKTKSVKDKKV